MSLIVAASVAHAQRKPPSCDDLKGPEKEACLKQGGTVKANSAAGGSTSKPQPSAPAPTVGSSSERTAEPDAKKDYTKPDSK